MADPLVAAAPRTLTALWQRMKMLELGRRGNNHNIYYTSCYAPRGLYGQLKWKGRRRCPPPYFRFSFYKEKVNKIVVWGGGGIFL